MKYVPYIKKINLIKTCLQNTGKLLHGYLVTLGMPLGIGAVEWAAENDEKWSCNEGMPTSVTALNRNFCLFLLQRTSGGSTTPQIGF
ncbi:MAG: hypothetical protein B6247_08440 [Candidatus Parabeggiatoa sp. nov. 2]|nr:MAG: hypothetical protein B6247_08440 [Beggiatoa sp. 4572_84]